MKSIKKITLLFALITCALPSILHAMNDKQTTIIRAPKLSLGPVDPETLRCKGQYPSKVAVQFGRGSYVEYAMAGLPTNKHDLLLMLGMKHHPIRQVTLKYPTGVQFEIGELNLDKIIYP
jgi:hypothetical protein